jgi:hypothetical protein
LYDVVEAQLQRSRSGAMRPQHRSGGIAQLRKGLPLWEREAVAEVERDRAVDKQGPQWLNEEHQSIADRAKLKLRPQQLAL